MENRRVRTPLPTNAHKFALHGGDVRDGRTIQDYYRSTQLLYNENDLGHPTDSGHF